MPKLVRLYIRQVAIGFLLSVVFVALLMWFNIGNLWHLVTHASGGWIALALLVIFNGIVFAGVQFGISIMRMAENGGDGGRGKRVTFATPTLPRGGHVPVATKD